MEKIIYLSVHLLIPLIIIFCTILLKPKSRLGLLSKSALNFFIISFLFLWGQWPLTGSYYLRYFMILILLLILGFGILRFERDMPWRPVGNWAYLLFTLKGLGAILFIFMTTYTLKGSKYPEKGVELSFPLKNGHFYIASGGSNKIINNHFRNYPNDQQYALDINRLGPGMAASKNILSSVNTDHHIYSDTIFCPCDGIVQEVENQVPENVSSLMQVDPEKGRGNYISMNCKGIIVSMSHLKMNSVLVSNGETVTEGQPLGQVGNSGFSQEPHLHLQTAIYNADSVLVGIPMQFEGRYLSRNDVVSN